MFVHLAIRSHKPLPYTDKFRGEILMEFKLNKDSQIEVNMKCRPVFLKSKSNGKSESLGMIEELVNKFFEKGTVKKFQDYVIPCLDQWIEEFDADFLMKDANAKKEVENEDHQNQIDNIN